MLHIAFLRSSKEEQEMLKKKWKTISSKQNSKQTSWLLSEGAWKLGLLPIGKRWCRYKACVHSDIVKVHLGYIWISSNWKLKEDFIWQEAALVIHSLLSPAAVLCLGLCSPCLLIYGFLCSGQRGMVLGVGKTRQIPQLWEHTLLMAYAYLAYSHSLDVNLCL